MNIEYVVEKPLDKKSINNFMDRTVYNVARTTLSLTAGHFPRRTGDLERTSYAMGVQGGNATYSLGAGVDYARYVWNMKDVHWTNPSTIPQWYYTIFKNKKEAIVSQAVSNSINTFGGTKL